MINKLLLTLLSLLVFVGINAQDLCNATVTNPRCVGESNGRIIVSPQGGTPGYTYNWSHVGSGSNLQSNLAPGTYTVTVEDATGLTEVCQYTLMTPTQMVINSIDITEPSCGVDDGIVVFDVTPSVTADPNLLMYSINGGSDFQSSATFTGVAEGDYIVIVRDEFGCQVSSSITLSADTQGLTAMSDGGCMAADEVWIDVSVTGGVGPYTYLWEDQLSSYSSMDAFNDNIPVGIFVVTVTDAVGCTASTNISLTNCCILEDLCPAVVTDASCQGDDGSIVITPDSQLAPFTYTWQHDGSLAGNTALGLTPGIYRVMVVDRVGCGISCVYTVGNDCGVDLCSGTFTDPSCRGDSDGTITVTPSEGVPPYSYSWAHTTSNSSTVTGLSAGTYFVTATDANGATSECEYLIMDPDQVVVIDANLDQPECEEGGNIEILLGVLTGTGSFPEPYTGNTTGFLYSIDGGSTAQFSPFFSDLAADTYNLAVVGFDGCISPDFPVELEEPQDCANGFIGDFVWLDEDGDGFQDFGEPGIPNVTVILYNGLNQVLGSEFTDANGMYLFEELEPGPYYLRFLAPEGLEFTLPNMSSNDNRDSDVDNSNGVGTTPIINISNDETDLSIDAGLYECVEIGDFVWLDIISNEIQDPQERGVNNVRVNIYKLGVFGDYVLYDSQYTGAKPNTPSDDGYYKFCVPPGNYYLEFESNLNSLVAVNANFGNEEIDSDITGRFGFGTTDNFIVFSGEMKCDVDAGFYPASTIGDRVWLDDNGNGIQDEEEKPIANVKVELLDEEGTVLQERYTDNVGTYRFTNLKQGDYYVQVERPSGLYPTVSDASTTDTNDSDIDYSGRSARLSLESDQERLDVDAGFTESVVLPVAWLGFTAENRESYNELNWQTAAEFENEYFVIERNLGFDDTFSEIGRVSAKNSFQNINEYSFDDLNLITFGTYYYRIKQVDFSGEFSYSKIVAVQVDEASKDVMSLNVYPVPTNSGITIEFYSELATTASFTIYNTLGQVVFNKEEEVDVIQGLNVLSYDVAAFPKGVYNIVVKYKGRTLTENFVKL